MTANAYAQRADVYRHGVQPGMLVSEARLVASVEATTDVLELDDHGLSDGTPIVFRAEGGGSLPSPLALGTTYYARLVSYSRFQVAAAAVGGSPIDLTDAGQHVLVATELPVDETLERYARFIDDHLPAHSVPLEEPYPIQIVAINAELTARKLLWLSGNRSESVAEAEAAASKELARFAKGIPLRNSPAVPSANLAVAKSASADSRGWGNGGLLP